MPGHLHVFTCLVCLAVGPQVAAAQVPLPPSPTAPPEQATAVALRLNTGESIAVDGVLDEAAWERATPVGNFTQSEPRNGERESERTEIRILFSGDNLYIGAQFFDSDPRGMLGNQMVRDGGLGSDDRFMWVLDPLNDRRSGYFFEINPAGAMGDAQLVPSSGGSGSVSQNRAWNGIWLARVRRHDQGWTVEVEIPFRTVNFDPEAAEWGANFQRTVRRKNEEDYWTGWARNQGLYSLVSSGRIVGINDVSQGHGLDIKPYVVGNYLTAPGPQSPNIFKGSEGLDLFYNLTPQLRANITINTDFAQTEVDDRQVNLTRFPLFFPEKRDFFLESSGNFDFSRESQQDMTAFFTRRIGLDERGQPQDIDYGIKMAGTAAGLNLGVMQVRTGDQPGTPGDDFTIVRPKRQFFRQSYAGMIYTRRSAHASGIADRQTIGADFELATSRFRGSQNLQVNGYFVKTPDGTDRGDDAGFGLRVLYPNDLWSGRLILKEFQKNFDPAIGFRQRADNREYGARLKFAPRPRNSRIVRQAGAEAWVNWFSDTRGRWTDKNDQYIFDVDFQSGDGASFTINQLYENLQAPFRIASGVTLPPGVDYDFRRYTLRADTTTRRAVAFTANMSFGSFLSGHRRDLGVRSHCGRGAASCCS